MSTFLHFDATYYTGKPELRPAIHPCVCRTWVDYAKGETPLTAQRRYAQLADDTHALFCFDLEPLPEFKRPYAPELELKLDEWSEYPDMVRREHPNLCIGAYHQPWHWRQKFAYDAGGKSHWRGFTDRLNYAAPVVYFDVGMTYERWEPEAKRRFDISREYDRPTYCFYATTYQRPGNYGPIRRDLLARGLDLIRANADGVIWWGGWYEENGAFRQQPFNPADAWVELSKP